MYFSYLASRKSPRKHNIIDRSSKEYYSMSVYIYREIRPSRRRLNFGNIFEYFRILLSLLSSSIVHRGGHLRFTRIHGAYFFMNKAGRSRRIVRNGAGYADYIDQICNTPLMRNWYFAFWKWGRRAYKFSFSDFTTDAITPTTARDEWTLLHIVFNDPKL